ncbi:LytTR family DNA-binding domain-containing protein [Vagococcus humatus]|uniref:LytTR family transcriptional regulator n=1 Tax=Vagococcus humatus TaxID=1889241 RepID=A0A3R9YXY3_9ENTE|nr:LytTR family DNA-binding domain-containing protein [Vagococcus humatus]RST90013.1 LytTR family transcriptional regulator [Vagococcus humatus]
MKVNEYRVFTQEESRIDLYYMEKNEKINGLLRYLSRWDYQLIGRKEHTQVYFQLQDVYYFESVDKKTFVYLEKEVLQVEMTLADITLRYEADGFVRVSKGVVLNLYKLAYLKASLNMRVIAYLENGEKVWITRHYKPAFQARLEKLTKKETQSDATN